MATTMTVWFTVAYDSAVDFRFERRAPNGTWSNANLRVQGQTGERRGTTDRALSPQTVYCYRVIALNRFGESAGPEACKSTLRLALPMPTDLRVTSSSTSGLSLAWTDNAVDETYYQVIYRVKDAPISEPIITMAANPGTGPMTLDLNGLRANTEYCISVMARAPDAEESNAALICTRTKSIVSIEVFNVAPLAIQFCAPTPVNISWNVASASKITISRNGAAILSRDNPRGTSNWQDSFIDPLLQDATSGDINYSLLAVGDSGTTTTRQATVRQFSDYQIASVIEFINNSTRDLVLQKLDTSGRWNDIQLVPRSSYYIIPLDKCSTALFRAVD
ncbi:MAG: fibronectin type III domain-containing protein, partial [Fimbriimonadaceae bacterium]